ncbi:VWA domain-containing protein [Streptomyces litchfieldiae]|uniref:VWA domain-containing protein n=1 Tax=Streptomyces litchfieldiae TaxID=3075543 RepID=A0ABU2MIW3_9ACTN|nr:VWA domain-containing protein [Streptomyces sp. DSM 44938]MDT0341538.1 VWA domain-containing protein [Streptomyces sp. DSM 44938]
MTGAGPAERAGPRAELTAEYQADQYAAGDGGDVRVILKVTVAGLGEEAAGRAAHRSEIIIIDCSGSMRHPSIRPIAAARRAAEKAIELLPDGTHFALVRGNEAAEVVYPSRPGTVAADEETRRAGGLAARAMDGNGGTRISAWLDLARRLLAGRPDASLRHVLLLTDGRDRHEEEDELRRVLDACEGEFTCDALAIGEDWDVDQLREIVGRLNGRAAAVEPSPGADGPAFPEELTRMLTGIVRTATARTLPQLGIRVWTGPGVRISLFRQLVPVERDLTAAGHVGATDEAEGDVTGFATGAWGDETRWYELRLRAESASSRSGGGAGPGARIASVGLAAEGVALPETRSVTVRWTDESPPFSNPAPVGEHFKHTVALNEADQRGCRALAAGDLATAAEELGRAVRLARLLGDERRLTRLARLVVIEDADEGRVTVRADPDSGQLKRMLLESGYSMAPPAPDGAGNVESEGRPVCCPVCGEWVRPGRFCNNCGHQFADAP